MANRQADLFPTALTLRLDAQTWEQLEQTARQSEQTVEQWVRILLEKALRQEAKAVRRIKGALAARDLAPLDAFLPEGTDPFLPLTEVETGRPSRFEDIQTRMRFAGTPALLR